MQCSTMTSNTDINTNLPISLENIQPIIDRIHLKYPVVNKYEITLVVKSFFECIREILIAGDTISINSFFSKMHLISFYKMRKNKISKVVKVKLTTPRKFKDA